MKPKLLRSAKSLGRMALLFFVLVLLMDLAGLLLMRDSATTQFYLDNRSDIPVRLKIPEAGLGISSVVPPHSRAAIFEPQHGVNHPLNVFFLSADSRKHLGERLYNIQDVDRNWQDGRFVVVYP